MDFATFRSICLSMDGVTEDFPFDETTICFRVGNKIFSFCDVESFPFRFNLKCDPDLALELREKYSCITPGYYSNKKHWNTIEPDGSISDELITEMAKHSYQLVYDKLPKKVRETIKKS